MVLRLRLSYRCMTMTAVRILLAARKKPPDKERSHWNTLTVKRGSRCAKR